MKGAITAAIVCHGTDNVASTYFLPLGYSDTGQITVDRDIAAMPHKNIAHASKLEDTGNNAIEDSTSTGTWTTDIVRPLVVELHVFHARHIIDAKATAYHILPSDGHG